MKKIYMNPEMEVVDIKMNQQLLAGSVDALIDSGTQDNGDALAPELPGMPDFGPSIGSTLPLDF